MEKGYTPETLSGKLGMDCDELAEALGCPSYRILTEIDDILGVELWELQEAG